MTSTASVAVTRSEAATEMGVHANGSVQREMAWVVNKFGGTSVASAEAMGRVNDIITGQVRR